MTLCTWIINWNTASKQVHADRSQASTSRQTQAGPRKTNRLLYDYTYNTRSNRTILFSISEAISLGETMKNKILKITFLDVCLSKNYFEIPKYLWQGTLLPAISRLYTILFPNNCKKRPSSLITFYNKVKNGQFRFSKDFCKLIMISVVLLFLS